MVADNRIEEQFFYLLKLIDTHLLIALQLLYQVYRNPFLILIFDYTHLLYSQMMLHQWSYLYLQGIVFVHNRNYNVW